MKKFHHFISMVAIGFRKATGNKKCCVLAKLKKKNWTHNNSEIELIKSNLGCPDSRFPSLRKNWCCLRSSEKMIRTFHQFSVHVEWCWMKCWMIHCFVCFIRSNNVTSNCISILNDFNNRNDDTTAIIYRFCILDASSSGAEGSPYRIWKARWWIKQKKESISKD